MMQRLRELRNWICQHVRPDLPNVEPVIEEHKKVRQDAFWMAETLVSQFHDLEVATDEIKQRRRRL